MRANYQNCKTTPSVPEKTQLFLHYFLKTGAVYSSLFFCSNFSRPFSFCKADRSFGRYVFRPHRRSLMMSMRILFLVQMEMVYKIRSLSVLSPMVISVISGLLLIHMVQVGLVHLMVAFVLTRIG